MRHDPSVACQRTGGPPGVHSSLAKCHTSATWRPRLPLLGAASGTQDGLEPKPWFPSPPSALTGSRTPSLADAQVSSATSLWAWPLSSSASLAAGTCLAPGNHTSDSGKRSGEGASLGGREGQPHSLWGPVQNKTGGPLVKNEEFQVGDRRDVSQAGAMSQACSWDYRPREQGLYPSTPPHPHAHLSALASWHQSPEPWWLLAPHLQPPPKPQAVPPN